MRAAALAGLVVFVCLSMIFGTFVIVRFVMFILPSSLTPLIMVTDVLRVIVAVVLAYVYLRVWKMITDWYFWRSVRSSTRGKDEPL